jgi:hypothetical protein
MTQPTLLSFKSSKLYSNKNTSEIGGKMSTRKDGEEGPQGSLSGHTSPSPPPSTTDNGATLSATTPLEPHPERGPRPHPIMQDPEFQKRYRKFLKRNGLEYGTSDPKKSALWLHFWDIELKAFYEREEARK